MDEAITRSKLSQDSLQACNKSRGYAAVVCVLLKVPLNETWDADSRAQGNGPYLGPHGSSVRPQSHDEDAGDGGWNVNGFG